MVWDEVEYDCKNWTRRDCLWDASSTPSDSDRHAKNLWLTIEYHPLTTTSCEGIYPGVIFKALISLVEISTAYIQNTSYPALNPNLSLALTPSEVWERVTARPIRVEIWKLPRYCSAKESPEERETWRRANAEAMREARARESQEEG